MIKAFRVVSVLEGISYLLLLGVGVPLKYLAGNDILVKGLGMPHGLLFVLYIIMAYLVKEVKNWNFKDFAIVLLASVVPFGTFYVDWKYLRR